jgi:hypothetical protein
MPKRKRTKGQTTIYKKFRELTINFMFFILEKFLKRLNILEKLPDHKYMNGIYGNGI